MSLYIDTKYVGFVGHKLRNFARIDTNLWRFSCPICGDSSTVKTRTRGYIFMRDQKLRFQCHNCSDSRNLGKFLEEVDANLARDYRLEKFKDSSAYVHREVKKPVEVETDQNLFKTDNSRLKGPVVAKPSSVLDKLMVRLDSLPDDHEAVVYCQNRQIPKKQMYKMYVIDEVRNICRLVPKYKDRVKGKEPRLVFPFYTPEGKLGGVSMRGLRGESLRYITIKIEDDEVLIFGINDVDHSKPIFVVEGQFDSLFLPNCIAVGGTSMGKLAQIGLPKENLTVIFDNQPRNPQVCHLIQKAIREGYRVVIFSARIAEKDLNDMKKAGVDYMEEIRTRTFQGLSAQMQFNQWKKCT